MSAFDRYAPFVQDFIYNHDWRNLRAIQVAAAEAIFDTDENVLLSASTASGKTEAAFFPILTLLSEDPPASVGALYIAPLKALINDQFYRLNDLCEEAGIPVWHWHGDVSQSHKRKLLERPSGILQITPESLEAMLLRRHNVVSKLFCDLRFVVIDEIHSLMRGDRGMQTFCLIERLSRAAGVNPRRIGLSATVGDPARTGEMLAADSGRGTYIPLVEGPGQTWRISMGHFYVTGPQATEREVESTRTVEADVVSVERATAALPGHGELPPGCDLASSRNAAAIAPLAPLEAPTDTAPANADPGMGYIFEHTRGRKCLVFTNSREEAEEVTTTLRSYCEAVDEPDRFLIHHGNLSASFRESAEEVMKDDEQVQTTVATATLELGIDIGRLERAFQIDAPFTVSGFLQRMGRTGRRGAPAEMWFVMREEQAEPRSLLPETLPWKLLQGIALVQLYLEEHWVEPPREGRLPYSLLYHQTLSTLASTGELSPAQLAERVLTLSPFRNVTLDDFRELLEHLIETDHVERTESGGLIVGLAGERQVGSFKFFAVFQENEEYTVRSESQEIGTIVKPPPTGERIAIAGHVWIVEEVDHKRHLLYVTQVKGKVPAYFGDVAGDIDTRILERMQQVLLENRGYPYLMEHAVCRLGQARRTARAAGIGRLPLVNLGGNMWCLTPWLGSYAFLALERLLKIKCAGELNLRGLDSCRPYFMTFLMDADEETFLSVVAAEAEALEEPLDLVYPNEVPRFDKYDEFLPATLVRKGFAYGVLDVKGMRERVLGWVKA